MKTRPVHVVPLILISLTILLLAACGGGSPAATPTPTPSPMQMEIEAAIAQFEAQGIADYTMRVTYRKRGWNPQIMDLAVTDGQAAILEQNCIPERTCGLRPVEAADFTLDSIFTVVREQAALHEGIIEIAYHDAYGFPRIIATSVGAYEISNFQPVE